MVEFILRQGANPNLITDPDLGYTPLFDVDVFCLNANEWIEITRLLIEAGADLNIPNERGNTPLHNAVNNESAENIVKALIKADANLNAKNNGGETPLYVACDSYSCYENIVKLLIGAGANLNVADD